MVVTIISTDSMDQPTALQDAKDSSDPWSSDSASSSDASIDPQVASELVEKLKVRLRKAKAREEKALRKSKESKSRNKDVVCEGKADVNGIEDKPDPSEPQEDSGSTKLRDLQCSLRNLNFVTSRPRGLPPGDNSFIDVATTSLSALESSMTQDTKAAKPKNKPGSKVAYKRVDQLWDENIHNYKLTKTVKNTGDSEWDQYIFTVRRKFDLEHKYVGTIVDIKSKPLKECIQAIMAGIQGISLHEDKPHIDPNMLFLYLEEVRVSVQFHKDAAVAKGKIGDGSGQDEELTKDKHLEVMVKYLDKDYAEIKQSLYPMLQNNEITFDLLWALFKPNTIAYCSTYGDQDEPRAFKIDLATKKSHFSKGTWCSIEGKYLDFDGKTFGMTGVVDEVAKFEGARQITSLDVYPLQYHKDAEKLEAQLVKRGKRFVALHGMNYRYYNGMAYVRSKKGVMKINIDGRIMVDAAIHRRINPNYRNIAFRPKPDSSFLTLVDDVVLEIRSDQDNATGRKDVVADPKQATHEFTREELLTASPVALGFAFAEKVWLEFKVSAISEVIFNDQAFDSLVLPDSQKSLIKALVSSHSFHAHKSIDDIISGKGRGLVAVLHGPPGTGKTLTAEGIADLLQRPLYMVSAGDLGTEPTRLEKELQSVLDIAHSWGAILLLDEADVFLQERSIHDIHRNALVSIFLRLLEYFQGILFLTTNRVETFDSAFVSRIHLSLRFQPLTTKAKKTVWKLFIDRVKKQEGMEVAPILETDFTDLARRDVNGRQIKNLVRAAQALAVYEDVPLSMVHIRRVIDVAENFEVDLKGGTGFTDAMRSYT